MVVRGEILIFVKCRVGELTPGSQSGVRSVMQAVPSVIFITFRNVLSLLRYKSHSLKILSLSLTFFIVCGVLRGQTPSLQWARHTGGAGDDDSRSIVVDASGNIYTTGYFAGTSDFDPGAGVYNMTALGTHDLFILKLNSSGDFVWAVSVGGSSGNVWAEGQSVTVDPAGNIYATGWWQYTADFDPGPGVLNLTSAGGYDVFVLKLDPSGNLVFVKQMGGPNTDQGYDIHIDASGNILTTGVFLGTSDFDPGGGVYNIGASWGNIFVSKLDPSGNFLWAKSLGGSGYDFGLFVTTDPTGNVYTTGYFELTADFNPGAGTFNLVCAGNQDAFISKLDASGNFVWAGAMGGTGYEACYSLALDAAGNMYAAGFFQGNSTEDFDPGAGVYSMPTSGGSGDIFIMKIDASNNFQWALSMGGPTGADGAYSIALDASGNILIAGSFQFTADLDPGPGVFNLTFTGSSDVFVAKYDPSGNFIYAGKMGGAGTDLGKDMALDASGFPLVTGPFQQTPDFDPTGGVLNFTSFGGVYDRYVAKFGLIAPNITMSANKTICKGQSVSVNATGSYTSGPYTYSWTPSASLSNAAISNPMASPSATTNYTCVVTDGLLTTNTGTVTITISTPTVNMSSPGTICKGNSATLTASGGTSYLWSTGVTTVGISVSPSVTSTYTVTGTNSLGCQDTAVRTLTVNPLPDVSITGLTTLCAGDLTTLTASGAGTYSWNPGGQTTGSIVINPTAGTTYWVTGILNGCANSATVALTVNPTPVAGISAPGTICIGTSATLTSSGGGNYLWNTGSTTSVIAVSPTAAVSYSVVVSDPSGCTDSKSTTIAVSQTQLDPGNDVQLCLGDSGQLSAGGNAVSYSWSPSATLSNSTMASPIAFPTVTTTYTMVGANAFGCVATDSQTVFVHSKPAVSFTLNPDTVCIGTAPFILTGGTPAGGTYSGTGVSGGTFGPADAGTGIHSILYTYTDVNGCSGADSAKIFVDLCTGIEAWTGPELFSVFPNPSNGNFIVYSPAGPGKIEIVNMLGENIYFSGSGQIGTHIDLTGHPSGIYFLKLQTEEGITVKKIVKE